MITVARSSAFHYKKRVANTKTTAKKTKSCAKDLSTCSPSSSHSNLPTNNQSGNSLTVPGALRKRSGSVPALKLNTLATSWNLKYEQVRALRMTWARLCEPPRSHCRGIVNLVERVFEKIDTKDQTVRNIFYNAAFVDSMQERCERRRSKGSIATLRDHTHFFVSLVSQVIQNLDNEPDDMFNHIDQIGRNHAYLKKYGFKSTHWEKVGEYFVDIVVIQDCVRGFPEACRAWTILIAVIVDRLRAAPRRGSVACTPMGSMTSLQGSTQSINCGAMRRGSLAQNGSQSSIGSSGTCPMRIHGHHASTTDIYSMEEKGDKDPKSLLWKTGSSCIDLSPLANEYPIKKDEKDNNN